MITVVVADDQELIRAGLKLLLERVSDIEVIAEAADGDQAVEKVIEHGPDVVLLDIRMPNCDGLAATRRLMELTPQTKVLILTTFDADEYVYQALVSGASGFLLKSAPPERLIGAIRVIAGGESLLDPAVTRHVIEGFTCGRPPRQIDDPAFARMTEREFEVLQQIARGLSNAEIAEELVISEATVKTHVARLLAKLGLRDRVQAVIYAYDHGIAGGAALSPDSTDSDRRQSPRQR